MVLGGQLNLTGGLWDYAAGFNINRAGFVIVGLFIVIWVVALGIWRLGKVEHRWERAASEARAAGAGQAVPAAGPTVDVDLTRHAEQVLTDLR